MGTRVFMPETRVPPAAACTDPLVLGGDERLLVLLCDQDAGAVGGLQHVDHQVVGQHVQLLHLVTRHVHAASYAKPGENKLKK